MALAALDKPLPIGQPRALPCASCPSCMSRNPKVQIIIRITIGEDCSQQDKNESTRFSTTPFSMSKSGKTVIIPEKY